MALRAWMRLVAVGPLAAPLAASFLTYCLLGILLQSNAFHFYAAGTLSEPGALRTAIYVLAPNALLDASRYSGGGMLVLALYSVLALAVLSSWCWALRAAKRTADVPLASIIAATIVIAAPLLFFGALFSDDIYLYYLYGRTLETYAANPIQTPPAAFPTDPHLGRVHWKDLPSSYGPLWLMLSAFLSRLAGDSITTAVVAYRGAGLLLHLLTTVVVWHTVRARQPERALVAVIFYAWNPLVLLEVVANAHNDVMVALFAVTIVAAAATRGWAAAAFFVACAVMVKPFAVILFPPLLQRVVQTTRGPTRARQVALATGVLLATMVLLSLPLWAGMRLLSNVLNNPASHLYTNTLWELLSNAGPAWVGVTSDRIQHPYLDVARQLGFVIAACWILTRRWSRRGVAHSAFALWIVFLLTACWAWPWYFVPAIALAAISGRASMAIATALTAGGLVFWAAWPPPTVFGWLHTWRSVVLFGPLVVALASPRLRITILRALGETRREPQVRDGDAPPVRLQTATG